MKATPGPKGSFLLGNLREFSQDMLGFFTPSARDYGDVVRLRLVNRTASVDILVNNAGIQHVAPIEDFPPEKWDAILAINLSSAFHTIRALLPAMKARRWGRIDGAWTAH